MDLDALAGVVAYKHTGDAVMTVTAAVDRITLKRSLSVICDLELSGKVTFATGRSSMEVSLQVAKAPEEGKRVQEEDVLMTCALTMVSSVCLLLFRSSAERTRCHLIRRLRSQCR
jgi:acyl-coenzyme A thioesterase 9